MESHTEIFGGWEVRRKKQAKPRIKVWMKEISMTNACENLKVFPGDATFDFTPKYANLVCNYFNNCQKMF